jgi:hypothetical protein
VHSWCPFLGDSTGDVLQPRTIRESDTVAFTAASVPSMPPMGRRLPSRQRSDRGNLTSVVGEVERATAALLPNAQHGLVLGRCSFSGWHGWRLAIGARRCDRDHRSADELVPRNVCAELQPASACLREFHGAERMRAHATVHPDLTLALERLDGRADLRERQACLSR